MPYCSDMQSVSSRTHQTLWTRTPITSTTWVTVAAAMATWTNKTLDVTDLTDKKVWKVLEDNVSFVYLVLSPPHSIYYTLSRYLKLLPAFSIMTTASR